MPEAVEKCKGDWHVTFEFLSCAHPDLVKQDGPFVALITGDAYELLQHCPNMPRAWCARTVMKANA